MSLPRKLVEQAGSAVDPRKSITSDASGTHHTHLAPHERIVEVTSTLGVTTVYLPDVGEAEGMEYFITAITGDTNAVTVTQKAAGNSLDFPSDASLNAAYDRVQYKSDGKRWWIVTDQYT